MAERAVGCDARPRRRAPGDAQHAQPVREGPTTCPNILVSSSAINARVPCVRNASPPSSRPRRTSLPPPRAPPKPPPPNSGAMAMDVEYEEYASTSSSKHHGWKCEVSRQHKERREMEDLEARRTRRGARARPSSSLARSNPRPVASSPPPRTTPHAPNPQHPPPSPPPPPPRLLLSSGTPREALRAHRPRRRRRGPHRPRGDAPDQGDGSPRRRRRRAEVPHLPGAPRPRAAPAPDRRRSKSAR